MIGILQARLDAISPQPFKSIETAASLADVRENPPPRERTPIAYVIPLGHSPRVPEFATGMTSQGFLARYGVAIAAPAQAQREGEKAAVEIEPLYQAVRKQLFGWQPADAGEDVFMRPMELAGGQLSGLGAGLVIWLEQFAIEQQIRSAS